MTAPALALVPAIQRSAVILTTRGYEHASTLHDLTRDIRFAHVRIIHGGQGDPDDAP